MRWTIRVLKENGVKPSKKLSQNFVINPFLIKNMVDSVSFEDTVEIGCGIGTLTFFLLQKVKTLVCIEFDERMAKIVSKNIGDPRFILARGDILTTGLNRPQVVSNLPYHITSDVLILIARDNGVNKAVLTLQKEVGDRLVAPPGSESYGRLSIIIQLLFDIDLKGVYSSRSFYPEPKVASSIVVLKRKRNYDENIQKVENVTRVMFSQRRRNARKVAETRLKIKPEVLEKIIPNGKRVFELEPEVFERLSAEL
ncbi:MAG: 16S rRNA (adenine(1518)-N(6)/adenine(1519)-N(6))-dimethyltransferase RsmA [Thermosphaera sp.]